MLQRLIKGIEVLDDCPELEFIRKWFNLKPSLTVFVLQIVFFFIATPLLGLHSLHTIIACFLVPAYQSFLALQSKQEDDDIRYSTYWIHFSILEIATPFTTMIFSQLPHLGFRLIFTVLHLHPHSDLPLRIYRFYIQYFLKRMEDRIEDEVAETAVDSVIEKVKEAKS